MDLFFNPSVTETFGNVTVEAMASALPVVAAHATGSRDIVRHDVTGQLVDPGNASAFADALSAYCTDPALRRAHGLAGLEESRKYDWDAVNSIVHDCYCDLLAKRTRAA
jgi:glycosyltransferase involved in cell wall biosynthesis